MLFLGIATFSWFGRKALSSDLRQAICMGLSITMFALAILGICEFLRGFAGLGIGFAVVAEVALGAVYYQIWLSNKDS